MVVITHEEIVGIIKKINPSAEIKISQRGISSFPNVERFTVETHIFGADVRINVGENLVLLINGAPREVLMHLPLLDPDKVKIYVEAWLKNFEKYLERKEVPVIQALARTAFGMEEKIERKPNSVWVQYGIFTVIVTADTALVVLRSDNRIVLFRKFDNNKELADFFATGRYTAASVIGGDIH